MVLHRRTVALALEPAALMVHSNRQKCGSAAADHASVAPVLPMAASWVTAGLGAVAQAMMPERVADPTVLAAVVQVHDPALDESCQ